MQEIITDIDTSEAINVSQDMVKLGEILLKM